MRAVRTTLTVLGAALCVTAGAMLSPLVPPARPPLAEAATASLRAADDMLGLALRDWPEPGGGGGVSGALAQGASKSPDVRRGELSGSDRGAATRSSEPGTRNSRHGEDRWRNGRGAQPTLTPELMTACIEVAREIDRDMAAQLSALRTEDPAAFERVLRQSGRRLVAMAQLKQRDPHLYAMKIGEMIQEAQVTRVAGQLRAAYASGSEGEISVLEENLRTLIRVQLAMSIKARAEYLCRLEEHVEQVRHEIDALALSFPQRVEENFRAAIGDVKRPGDAAEAARPSETAPAE